MTIYIAGKIAGNPNYMVEFMVGALKIQKQGHIPLVPSCLPEGLTEADYMRICFAMIDVADRVAFLPNWEDSNGAKLEYEYCEYTGKPVMFLEEGEAWVKPGGGPCE